MTEPARENRTPFDWEARFQRDDAPWERKGPHPAVAHFRQAGVLTAGASIYVPGCGRGAEPVALAKLGLRVTASDVAPSAVKFQRDQITAAGVNATVIEADGLDWRPPFPFDLVWEQTFLCAIHPHDRARYEAMAFEALKPGGGLIALFMQKEERGGPPYGCSLEAMQALFTTERWDWPDDDAFTPFPHPALGGKVELGGVLRRR
ncbi:MAG: methyltransferase domain-containing protein [Oceanicaulis sp.]